MIFFDIPAVVNGLFKSQLATANQLINDCIIPDCIDSITNEALADAMDISLTQRGRRIRPSVSSNCSRCWCSMISAGNSQTLSSKPEIGYTTDDLRLGYVIAVPQIEKNTEKARLD